MSKLLHLFEKQQQLEKEEKPYEKKMTHKQEKSNIENVHFAMIFSWIVEGTKK